MVSNKATTALNDDTKDFHSQQNLTDSFFTSEKSIVSWPGSNLSYLTQPREWSEGNAVRVIMTSIYALIFTFGIVGNLTFCVVIMKSKILRNATNLYLFSMSWSDLFVLFFGMPYDFHSLWSSTPFFGNDYYAVFHSLLLETSTSASILTITFFTVERYIAICHPFQNQANCSLGRAPRNILIIWVVSICITIPVVMYHPLLFQERNLKMKSEIHSFITLSFIFLFVIPFILITFLYSRIILKLRKSETMSSIQTADLPSGFKMVSSPQTSKEMMSRYEDVIKVLGKDLLFVESVTLTVIHELISRSYFEKVNFIFFVLISFRTRI